MNEFGAPMVVGRLLVTFIMTFISRAPLTITSFVRSVLTQRGGAYLADIFLPRGWYARPYILLAGTSS